MKKVIAAVDPGKSGAIVIMEESGDIISYHAMPQIGKQYNLPELISILKTYELHHVAIEDVHAHQMAGNTSSFEFGYGKGVVEMALVAFEIPYTQVQPKLWQSVAWEGVTKVMLPTKRKNKAGDFVMKVDTKATSLIACQRLFPKMDLRDPNRKTDRGFKAHDGLVDAILICYYLHRKLFTKN